MIKFLRAGHSYVAQSDSLTTITRAETPFDLALKISDGMPENAAAVWYFADIEQSVPISIPAAAIVDASGTISLSGTTPADGRYRIVITLMSPAAGAEMLVSELLAVIG